MLCLTENVLLNELVAACWILASFLGADSVGPFVDFVLVLLCLLKIALNLIMHSA